MDHLWASQLLMASHFGAQSSRWAEGRSQVAHAGAPRLLVKLLLASTGSLPRAAASETRVCLRVRHQPFDHAPCDSTALIVVETPVAEEPHSKRLALAVCV
jgi:hypothetical protein